MARHKTGTASGQLSEVTPQAGPSRSAGLIPMCAQSRPREHYWTLKGTAAVSDILDRPAVHHVSELIVTLSTLRPEC